MNPYEAVAAYIQERNIAQYQGSNINLFIGNEPPSPDTCLVLNPTPGIYDPDNIVQPYDKGTFQLVSRSKNWILAYDTLRAIYNVLQNKSGQIQDRWFVEIVALQPEPYLLGKDSLNRYRLVQNYRFEVYNKTENRY